MNTPTLESMHRSTVHALSPQANLEERARQAFVLNVKRGLGPLGAQAFQQICAHHGAEAPEQVASVLQQSSSYAAWTALSKGAQRQMWRALSDMIHRQEEALQDIARDLETRPALGSLHLDPDVAIPAYLQQTAFHGQPGGYVLTRHPGDLYAGLMQEAGGTLYTRGVGTGVKDSKAQATVRFIRDRFPGFAPTRILDIGCGYGAQTCGYALAFAPAETHGVDVGGAVLRFGHLRAESLSVPLHLHQMDAAATSFPDGSFDLIVSNIVLHEVPADHLQALMHECRRLLAPGGLVLHQDMPVQRPGVSALRHFLAMWQRDHNDEPHWDSIAHIRFPDLLSTAGFVPDGIFEDYVAQVDGPMYWYMVGAQG
ncbi:class I SAM-dependent methyltransferase [Candidatus Entotheonella palauensis]|uniref:class I SAM-dependent methyltransferase n=1 Tax=Candidatus Entotheonella palauensis TaxID=93172 RepID=UPI0015C4C7B4|nr:class I SAM-dependent methyltransferase [Candidatus Entotheonella palauensis]